MHLMKKMMRNQREENLRKNREYRKMSKIMTTWNYYIRTFLRYTSLYFLKQVKL